MKTKISISRVLYLCILTLTCFCVGCGGETATRPTGYVGPPSDEEAAPELEDAPDEQIEAPPGA